MALPNESGVTNIEQRIIEYLQHRREESVEAIAAGETDAIEIDCTDVDDYDDGLWTWMQHNPDRWDLWWKTQLAHFDEECEEYAEDDDWDIDDVDWDDDWGITESVTIEYANFPDAALMDIGEPRTSRLGQAVKVRGVVRQLSSPKSKVETAYYECQRCGTMHQAPVDGDDVYSPFECESCEKKGPWGRELSMEDRIDYQEMHIQEKPGDAMDTSNPREIIIKIEGTDLTDSAMPGDRVEVCGVLKEEIDDEDAVLVDASMEAIEIDSEEDDFDSLELTDEEIDEFEELSERADLLEILKRTLAPDIYGHDLAKEAVLHQLFGGVTRFADDPQRSTKGGEIHQAWIGDPGSGKSELAKAARRVAPRSVKAVGNGATKAGMTASAVKQEIAGSSEWTLQAGALVLGDKGLVTVDELDKADEEVQNALHEALSDREVSVNKADITDVTLKARTSALMVANPVYSRFDKYEPLAEQFGLADSLLDRADMVITFKDEPDEEVDGEIADTILGGRWDNSGVSNGAAVADGSLVDADGMLGLESMRKYIAYARREYRPSATDAAREKLKDYYLTIRGLSDEDTISISARALDSLARFAEAHARMHLRDTVTVEDAENVIEMFMESYKELGVDPDTGDFNADRFSGREGSAQREKQRGLIREKVKALGDEDYGAPKEEVVEEVSEELDSEESVIEYVVNNMLKQGDLYTLESESELRVNGGGC
jgi:replicative DNA helicase Mcm